MAERPAPGRRQSRPAAEGETYGAEAVVGACDKSHPGPRWADWSTEARTEGIASTTISTAHTARRPQVLPQNQAKRCAGPAGLVETPASAGRQKVSASAATRPLRTMSKAGPSGVNWRANTRSSVIKRAGRGNGQPKQGGGRKSMGGHALCPLQYAKDTWHWFLARVKRPGRAALDELGRRAASPRAHSLQTRLPREGADCRPSGGARW